MILVETLVSMAALQALMHISLTCKFWIRGLGRAPRQYELPDDANFQTTPGGARVSRAKTTGFTNQSVHSVPLSSGSRDSSFQLTVSRELLNDGGCVKSAKYT